MYKRDTVLQIDDNVADLGECCREVVVTNFDKHHIVKELQLEKMFMRYNVVETRIVYNQDLSAKAAYLTLKTGYDAERVVKDFSGYWHHNSQLTVVLKEQYYAAKRLQQVKADGQSQALQAYLAPIQVQKPLGRRTENSPPGKKQRQLQGSPCKSESAWSGSTSVSQRVIPPFAFPTKIQTVGSVDTTVGSVDSSVTSFSSRLHPYRQPSARGSSPPAPHQDNGGCSSRAMIPHEPPQHDQGSPHYIVEQRIRETGVEIPAVFVTNFADRYNEKDLISWFVDYNPVSVEISKTSKGWKKAVVELPSVEMVRKAIRDKCFANIRGFRLKVDVPYFLPLLRQEVLGTKGQIVPSKRKKPKPPQVLGDPGFLHERAMARQTVVLALVQPEVPVAVGDQVEVIVTSVISDCYFTGQIVHAESLKKLEAISEKLNSPFDNYVRVKQNGPCVALNKKDGQWYRGWNLTRCECSKEIEVYFLDYGHLVSMLRSDACISDQAWIWELRPLALPFMLSEPVLKLNARVGNPMIVEVLQIDEDRIITAKARSLVKDWKSIIDTESLLCG